MNDQAHELRKLVSRVRTEANSLPSRVEVVDSGPPLFLIVDCCLPSDSRLAAGSAVVAANLQQQLQTLSSDAGATWRIAIRRGEFEEGHKTLWQQATAAYLLTDGGDSSLLRAYTTLKLAAASALPAAVELVFAPAYGRGRAAEVFNRFAATSLEHLHCTINHFTNLGENAGGVSTLFERMLAIAPAHAPESSQKPLASVAACDL